MKLKDLQNLVNRWMDSGDWDEAEVAIPDHKGQLLHGDLELQCGDNATHDGRDMLLFVEK